MTRFLRLRRPVMGIPRLVRAAIVAVAMAATLGPPTASAGDIVVRRDGSRAVDVPAAPPAPIRPDAGDGFDLDDAGVGAAGMLALVLASSGLVSLRGRRQSPRGAL
jgi:hypothetical protein